MPNLESSHDLGSVQVGDAVSRWCRAGETEDAIAAVACLATDVVLISPLTDQFRFRGRDQVQAVLEAVFSVVDDLVFDSAIGEGQNRAVRCQGRVGGHVFEEVQLLRLDAAGLISEVTLFIRPLPALTALMQALGPELARRQDRPWLAAFLVAATRPLHAMTTLGDRRVVPLAAPRR